MQQMKRLTMYYKNQLVKTYYFTCRKRFNTTIGEGGIKVSGGENNVYQLLALLRKPRLLFDEATSALDSITEEEITKPYEVFHLKKIR
jgi:ABC-type multidrug transport system fused ATPase/permease subunit